MGAWPYVIAIVVQVGLVVWTAFPPASPALGAPTWHHNASLAVTLLAFSATALVRAGKGRLITDRAHLGIGVLVWTLLAVVSGFALLYLKQGLKAWELKDWAKWWHITWSWLALWYFIAHTAVNWKGYLRAAKRHLRGVGAAVFTAAMLAIAVAIPMTWSDLGARVFTDPRYVPMTLWTWMVMLLPVYAVWLWTRVRSLTWAARAPVVAFVNVWLLPMTILANVSGFPILWFGTKDTSLKYVAKYWHAWPSIAMAILVFAHTIQWWASVRRHWHKAQAVTG